MGVTVTFVAILELVREGLIEIVQTEPFAPLHVRPAGSHRGLRLVANNERGEEEVIAADVLPAQPEGPTADELLLASQEPFEDDTTFDLEEDEPLIGLDVPVIADHAPASAEVEAAALGDGPVSDVRVDGEAEAVVASTEPTGEADVLADAAAPASEHVDEVGHDADAPGEKPTNADEVG
jgi:hypothetical protein